MKAICRMCKKEFETKDSPRDYACNDCYIAFMARHYPAVVKKIKSNK